MPTSYASASKKLGEESDLLIRGDVDGDDKTGLAVGAEAEYRVFH